MSVQTVARLGAKIETVTPAEMEEIIQRSLVERDIDEYLVKRGVIKLDGAGAGTTVGSEMNLDLKVSSQFDWELERISVGGAGAPSALVGVYENDAGNDTNMLEIIGMGTVGKYSDSFSNNVYVTANTQIVIVVTGGVAGQDVTFRLQIKQKKHRSRNKGV